MATKIIAEIGINHNGCIDTAKRLMMVASAAGCDYAKFQKRNPDVCVPEDQKSKIRSTPWGDMTYLEYKHRIEFNRGQMLDLIQFGRSIGIGVFASVWDVGSAELMSDLDRGVAKIPSALITDLDLCRRARELFDLLIISTGMSTEEEIDRCVAACNPDVIMHTNSTYPCPVDQLNLNYLLHLRSKHPDRQIGYSGHEYGLVTTFATVPMGASWIERHITLDRQMWGSDHASSVEPAGLMKLVRGIRDIEYAMGVLPGDRTVTAGELDKMKSLRK